MKKYKLGNYPTKIAYHQKLSCLMGLHFYTKNEFEADALGGGNKVRKIEYYLQYIISNNITDVIADGDVQSNCCSALAGYLIPLGVRVHLVLSGENTHRNSGNFLQMKLMGASIHEVGEWSLLKIKNRIDQIRDSLETEGKRASVFGEVSLGMALNASTELASEIQTYERENNIAYDYIFVPVGTGETFIGIEMYGKRNKLGWKVIGISIANDANYFTDFFAKVNTLDCWYIEPSGVDVRTAYIGGGYGVYNATDIDEIVRIRREYGLLLDSTWV